jgi:hypothetical protein
VLRIYKVLFSVVPEVVFALHNITAPITVKLYPKEKSWFVAVVLGEIEAGEK